MSHYAGLAPDLLGSARLIYPSAFDEGDRVVSTDGVREMTVREVEPITIFYYGHPVDVWWIKGFHAGHDVQTVSVPQKKWYRLSP